MKMAEFRARNARAGVMVDEQLAALSREPLARHHRGVTASWVLDLVPGEVRFLPIDGRGCSVDEAVESRVPIVEGGPASFLNGLRPYPGRPKDDPMVCLPATL